jgi:Tfp pilus assembly protein PilX
MRKDSNYTNDGERGIALITALMISTLLLALGMAVAFSATSDTVITKSHRVGEQAFFTADAGVAIARRALSLALQEEVERIKRGEATYGNKGFQTIGTSPDEDEFPIIQVLPDPDTDPNNVVPAVGQSSNNSFYQNVYVRARELASVAARNQTLRDLNGTSFTVNFRPLSGDISLVRTPGVSTRAVEVDTLRYTIEVTGTTEAGGSASVVESGRMTMNITLANGSTPGVDRSFGFSGFGAFFDDGDTIADAAMAGGTFSGPVHSNTHLAFFSSRNVTFRNVVSQVDDYIRYDSTDFGRGRISIPTTDIKGIDISSEGYKRIARVPLPTNSFSQEYAVINGTGILDKKPDGTPYDPPARIPVDINGLPLPIFDLLGRVTPEVMAVNLRDENNKEAQLQLGRLKKGVYLPSADGEQITGAGIYVQGDAADIQLYADGTDQLYVIAQNGSGEDEGGVTTIRVSTSRNETTISSAGKTTAFKGVPTDKSNPKLAKPGVSLFVNGDIASLRGGVSGSTRVPAIASDQRITITSQGDITITGDIKYADPVVNSDGSAVSNLSSVQNVLGLFTNDGNVNLAPKSSYVSNGLSLEMHAAVIAFNSNKLNDLGKIDGSIVYTGSTQPGSGDKWKLVGSRVQSKINNIGYSVRDIFFDVRFSGGSFAPPFFPGTKYDLGKESDTGEVAVFNVDSPTATGLSWYRDNN